LVLYGNAPNSDLTFIAEWSPLHKYTILDPKRKLRIELSSPNVSCYRSWSFQVVQVKQCFKTRIDPIRFLSHGSIDSIVLTKFELDDKYFLRLTP